MASIPLLHLISLKYHNKNPVRPVRRAPRYFIRLKNRLQFPLNILRNYVISTVGIVSLFTMTIKTQ